MQWSLTGGPTVWHGSSCLCTNGEVLAFHFLNVASRRWSHGYQVLDTLSVFHGFEFLPFVTVTPSRNAEVHTQRYTLLHIHSPALQWSHSIHVPWFFTTSRVERHLWAFYQAPFIFYDKSSAAATCLLETEADISSKCGQTECLKHPSV